ncbi:MAG TPA: lysophospholipid acyltransferase family protein [Candidatus Krumholzibacteria bacterium]
MKSPREIRHYLEYAAVRGMLALAGSLPRSAGSAIGASLGSLAFTLGVRREVSIGNIVAALGVSRAEASRIARRSYQNLGRGMMEFAGFRRLSAERVRAMARVEGFEHLEAARRAGRGGIVVTGHFGCWELGGAIVPAKGLPMNYVVGEQTNHRVDDVINDLRRTRGVGIIPRAVALKKVLQLLRANEFVALLADQDARKGGIIVDFLGRPASTVRGPALFAIRAPSPIVPLIVLREGRGYRIIFEAPIWPDPAMDEEAQVLDLTRRYTDFLSRWIRERPEEYFWPHRRWKSAAAQLAKTQAVEAGS